MHKETNSTDHFNKKNKKFITAINLSKIDHKFIKATRR